MGIHAIYGEDYVSKDLLTREQYADLVQNDSSQLDDA